MNKNNDAGLNKTAVIEARVSVIDLAIAHRHYVENARILPRSKSELLSMVLKDFITILINNNLVSDIPNSLDSAYTYIVNEIGSVNRNNRNMNTLNINLSREDTLADGIRLSNGMRITKKGLEEEVLLEAKRIVPRSAIAPEYREEIVINKDNRITKITDIDIAKEELETAMYKDTIKAELKKEAELGDISDDSRPSEQILKEFEEKEAKKVEELDIFGSIPDNLRKI